MVSKKRRISRLTRLLKPVANLPIVVLAMIWRRTVARRVTLIAITGSVGKTTAKDCLAAILSQSNPITANRGGSNGRWGLPKLLLRARPSDRFIVAEVGILKPGRMWRSALMLKPDVAVVTTVNWQHAKNFASLDHIAEQKSRLLDPLTKVGVAVLNGDNPHVAKMGEGRPCQVRTFGLASQADFQGKVAEHQWPARLTLEVTGGEETRTIQTRLVGPHWAVSVLAAVAAARSVGVSWEDCQKGIQELEPHPARLSPVRLPSGAILLRDEYNGSFAAFEQAAELLERAQCERKILALGHIFDAPHLADKIPEEVGKRAASAADLLLLWGAHAERSRSSAIEAGLAAEKAIVFNEQRDLADFLKRESRSGDLILLKGYWFDHMTRVVYEQFGSVGCQVSYCEITGICDPCDHMNFRLDPTVRGGLDESLAQAGERLSER